MNRWAIFHNIYPMEIAVRTIFEQLYFVALEGVGVNWKKNFFKLSNLHSKTSKNSKKMLVTQSLKFFLFFRFNRKSKFVSKQKNFQKKFHEKFNFMCAWRSPGYTKMWFFVSLNNFSKTQKILFLLNGMFMYASINVWYFENLNFENNHLWKFLPNLKSLMLSL